MPNVYKTRLRLILWLLLLLVVTGGLVWMRFAHDAVRASTVAAEGKTPAAREHTSTSNSSGSPGTPGTNPKTSAMDKTPAPSRLPPPDAALLARFKAFYTRLLGGMSRDEALAALKDLKQRVHDLPPETAASTLIALLQSGEDASTGLAFVVGDEGVLDESPTYRVALLDLLGQTDPDATVAYSRTLLTETTRPDEYALGLRNLAWLNHDGELNREIGSCFAAMLNRDEWRAHPTAGYLEAFDIAAALGGTSMVAELSSVLRLTTPQGEVIQSAVNRATFIALDRIMLREPDTIAGLYAGDPTFLDFAPNHRASLLARLDPTAPAQEQALRVYLLSLPPESRELTYFAKVFPNGNFFEGNRLASSWETASTTATGPQRDQAVLNFVNTLLADKAYASVASPLQTIRTRLQSFASDSSTTPAAPH